MLNLRASSFRLVVAIGIFAMAGINRVVADPIMPDFTDAATFNAAHPGLSVATFEGFSIPGGISGAAEVDLTDAGATFNGESYVVSSGYSGPLPDMPTSTGPYADAGSQYLITGTFFGVFEIDLGGSYTAIGIDIGSLILGSSELEISIEFNNGDTYTFVPGASFQFAGFEFDNMSPVSGVEILFTNFGAAEAQNFAGIDNLAFGEPATMGKCGDGTLDAGEECDDGPANSDTTPDACRTDCTNPICGDGVVDSGEQCDNGPANSDTTPDACRTTCVNPICGDGVVDSGEQCDNGPANSDTTPDACRTTCLNPTCGDGVVDMGEQCDNGPANSDTTADACRTTCVNPICGDGVVDMGEECDNGPANSNSVPNACRTDCTNPSCGDGVVDMGEQCDNGPANSDSAPNACRTDCTNPSCGDGVVDMGEQCDNGPANSNTVPNACRLTCLNPACGDDVVDAGEQCDDGAANSNSVPNACRTSCLNPICGDDVVDSGEQCDNGPANSNTVPSACRTNCMFSSCGDGVIDANEDCEPDMQSACPGKCDACSCPSLTPLPAVSAWGMTVMLTLLAAALTIAVGKRTWRMTAG